MAAPEPEDHGHAIFDHNDAQGDSGENRPFPQAIRADFWATIQLRPHNNQGGCRAPPCPSPI